MLIFMMIGPLASAQIDHKIGFTIKNFGVGVDGFFETSRVTGTLDLTNPANTNLQAVIQVSSINTDNDSRDSHLVEEDYFDAQKYPQMRFRSTAFRSKGGGEYELKGELTIKGKTQSVTIPLERVDQRLSGGIKINRLDFKVGGRSLILSKTVTINLQIEIPNP